MNRLREYLYGRYTMWFFRQQDELGSLYHFLLTLRNWWRYRPRRIACDYCGRPLWHNGLPGGEMYCSPGCAYYGPHEKEQEEELPF